MNEIQNISKDIRNKMLPVYELPRFASWLVVKHIGGASIFLAIVFLIAFALTR